MKAIETVPQYLNVGEALVRKGEYAHGGLLMLSVPVSFLSSDRVADAAPDDGVYTHEG